MQRGNANRSTTTQQISSKATKTLGFLRRNLAFAPRSTKEVAYKTLVHLNFTFKALNLHREKSTLEKIVPQGLIWNTELEYAAPIWSPYSKLQINQVEKACWTCK